MDPVTVAFYTGLMASVSAMITLITRSVLKSNCVSLDCGCFSCQREATHIAKELELTVA